MWVQDVWLRLLGGCCTCDVNSCLLFVAAALADARLVPAHLPSWPAQFLVSAAAQRVFLVAEGGVRLLEGGVAEYVAQLAGKKKGGKAAACGQGTPAGGKTAAGGGAKKK